jgi:hypothetical protein
VKWLCHHVYTTLTDLAINIGQLKKEVFLGLTHFGADLTSRAHWRMWYQRNIHALQKEKTWSWKHGISQNTTSQLIEIEYIMCMSLLILRLTPKVHNPNSGSAALVPWMTAEAIKNFNASKYHNSRNNHHEKRNRGDRGIMNKSTNSRVWDTSAVILSRDVREPAEYRKNVEPQKKMPRLTLAGVHRRRISPIFVTFVTSQVLLRFHSLHDLPYVHDS